MVKIHFDTDNASFGETEEERREEIAKTLESLARKIRNGYDAGLVMDTNGNRIGSFSIE